MHVILINFWYLVVFLFNILRNNRYYRYENAYISNAPNADTIELSADIDTDSKISIVVINFLC